MLKSKASDLNYFKAQIEDGKVRSVIDRAFLLEQLAEAHAYVEKMHTVGKNVVAIAQYAN